METVPTDNELLVAGIHDTAVRLGIIQEGTPLTGPQCLMLLKEIEGLAASAQPDASVQPAQGEQSDLASAFQEFVYRVVSQVPFGHAAWANERAAALMQEIKRLTAITPVMPRETPCVKK